MGSVARYFEPGDSGTVRVRVRFEDDEGRVGHTDERVERADRFYFDIPFDQLVAARYGIIDVREDGTATIRSAGNTEEAETAP